jgi:hypothetical protein
VDLLAAQQRDDAAVDDALIADSGARLVALLGVVLHELLAQLLNGGRLTRFRLGCAGITTPAYLSQSFLRERVGLFDGQFPVLPQSGLAALAGVCPVLEHEHLAARRGNLAQEAGHQRIPSLTACACGCAASTADLVSLIFAMMTPQKDPVPRSLLGASRGEVGASFRKHRHMMGAPNLLINFIYLVLA